MSGYVFVSYSSADRPYVERLARHLIGAGVPTWYDHQLATGDRWQHVLQNRIRSCTAVIVVMTPEADESVWIERELNLAEQLGKPVFPLLLRGHPMFRLNNLHFENVTDGSLPEGRLISTLLAVVDEPASPAAAGGLTFTAVDRGRSELTRLDSIRGAAFAPDRPELAVANSRFGPLLWTGKDWATPTRLHYNEPDRQSGGIYPPEQATAVAYSEAGRWLAFASTKQSDRNTAAKATVWDARRTRPVRNIEFDGAATSVAVTEQGDRVILAGIGEDGHGRADVVSIATGARQATVRHGPHVAHVESVPGRSHFLTLADDGTAALWRTETGRRAATFDQSPLRGVAADPAGNWLVTGDAQGRCTVRTIDTNTQQATFSHGSPITSVTAPAAPTAKDWIITTGGHRAAIWQAATGALLADLPLPQPADAATLSPDGTLLVIRAADELRFWHISVSA